MRKNFISKAASDFKLLQSWSCSRCSPAFKSGMRKKFMAGAAILALLMNSPQVKADDEIVIFGGEFEDSEKKVSKKEVEKPMSKSRSRLSPKSSSRKINRRLNRLKTKSPRRLKRRLMTTIIGKRS